jgi:hypothetical protein
LDETGIEDERTVARYKRSRDSERREILVRTDRFGSGRNLIMETRTSGGQLLSLSPLWTPFLYVGIYADA